MSKATVWAKVTFEPNESGVYWFERSSNGGASWVRAPAHRWGPVGRRYANLRLPETLTGLAAGTNYRFRICGYLTHTNPDSSTQCMDADGRAGGAHDSFTTPQNVCSATLSAGGSLQSFLNARSNGQVACLNSGTYAPNARVDVTRDITLRAAPGARVTIKGELNIQANGVDGPGHLHARHRGRAGDRREGEPRDAGSRGRDLRRNVRPRGPGDHGGRQRAARERRAHPELEDPQRGLARQRRLRPRRVLRERRRAASGGQLAVRQRGRLRVPPLSELRQRGHPVQRCARQRPRRRDRRRRRLVLRQPVRHQRLFEQHRLVALDAKGRGLLRARQQQRGAQHQRVARQRLGLPVLVPGHHQLPAAVSKRDVEGLPDRRAGGAQAAAGRVGRARCPARVRPDLPSISSIR